MVIVMRKSFVWLGILCMALALTVQSCEKSDGYERGNEAVTWRSIDKEQSVGASADNNFEFKFVARAAWTAESDNPAMLTIRTAKSGDKGTHNMTIAISENNTGVERTGRIMITVDGYEPEELMAITQSDTDHPDYAANKKSDEYLSEYYLWNDEYNTLTRNLSQPYDEFVENTLASMKTNGEDGGLYSDGSRYLYSFIERYPASSATRSVLTKTAEVSFGFISLTFLSFSNSNGAYGFAVDGVYPDSPAARAGIVRGDIIAEWNGANITASNYVDVFYTLLMPSAGEKASFKLNVKDAQTITLSAESMYKNPVLHAEIVERGDAKIGYLVYSDFEASFDDELLIETGKFKAAGITDMVLDLRINGGGHVISAQMMASIIAGEQGEGKDCLKYEYNPDRMRKKGYSKPDNMETMKFGYNAAAPGKMSRYSKSDYLSLSRVYVLVTGNTASASELTFTALRGIDFPVTLIGERTEGKNVGMEPDIFVTGGYEYMFYPITFRYFNAKNETCDPEGTQPDYEVEDWNDGYSDWGSENDPMLAKAVALITGEEKTPETRAVEKGRRAVPVADSKLKYNPRRGGLVAPVRESK